MCKNGKSLFTDITETIVLEKQKIGIESFFRIYDLNDIGGILIVTEEFQSRQDKKNNHSPLIHFPANSDYIYYSSYGASSENKDIYFRFRKSDGSWSDESPVLGEVNSQYDEDYPYMHPSGEYLYFSSNGHKSIGGYDVFRSKYDPSTQSFGQPENMNISISSPDNDFLYIVDSLDRHAYFASQRESELDKVHVYKLRVERLPMELIVLKGDFNSNINPNQKEISIKVKDLQGDVLGNYSSNKRGEYTIQLPSHGSYEFIVAVKGKENLHSEIVEIPKLDQFRPLKQQITEIDKNGENEIVFKNEFDKLFANQYEILAEAIENKAKMDINKGQFDLDSLDRAKKEKQKLEKFGLSAYTTIELKDLIETKYEDLALRQSSTDSLIQKSKNTLQSGNAKLLAAISSADSLTKLSKQNPNSSKVEEWKDLARKESRRSKQIEEDMTNAEIILSFLEEDLEENKANFKEAQSLQNEVKNLSNDEENAIISAMVRHEVFVKNELKERTRTNAYFEYLAHINEELRRRDLLVGKRDSLQNEQTQTKNKIQQLEKQYAEASKRAQKDLSFEISRAQILLEGIDNEIAYLDGVIEEKSKVANQKAVLADISKDSEAENTISSETLAEQLNTAKEQLSSIEEEIEVLNEPSEESEELAENQSENEVESETQSEDIIAEQSSNNQEEKPIEKEEPIEDKSKEESIAEERNKASEENTQTESSEDIAVEEEPLEEEPLIVPTLSDVDPNYEDEYKNLEKEVDFREKDKSVLVQRKKEAKLKVEKALLNAENELQESPNEEQLIANHTALKELNKKLEYEIEALELEILKDEMFAHNTGNHRSQNENESEENTSTLAENNSSETQNEDNLEVQNETQSENESESEENTSTLAENNSSETQNEENLETQSETQKENESEVQSEDLAENQSENESESEEETSTLAENNSSETQNEENLETQSETQKENESEVQSEDLAENQSESKNESELTLNKEVDKVFDIEEASIQLLTEIDPSYLDDISELEKAVEAGNKSTQDLIKRKYKVLIKVGDVKTVATQEAKNNPSEEIEEELELLTIVEDQISTEIKILENELIFAQSNEDAQEKTELQNLSTITRSSVPQELSRKLMREDREYLSELFDQKEDLIRQLNNDPSLVEDKKFKKQLVRNKDEIAYYMNTVLNYSILENFPDLEKNTEKLSNNNPEEVTALQSKQSLIKINALIKEAESTKDAEDLYKVLKSAYDEQEKAKARIQNHKKQKRINSYIAQLKKNSDLENINEETVASTIEDIEQDQKELSQQLIELNDQINSLNSKMVKAKKKEIKFLDESIRELEEIQMGVQNKYYENNTIIEEHNAERKKENNKGVDDEAIKNTLTYKEEVEIAQSQDYIAQLKNSNRLTQLQYELNIKQTQLDNRKNELNNLYKEIKEQPRFTEENKKELEEKLKEISASKVEIEALRQNIFEQQDLVASNLPDNIILRNKVENLIARDVAPIKEAPIRRRVQTGLTITENPEEAKIAYSDDNPIPVIEKQDEQLGGLIFRVQIGAFRNPVPNETFGAFSPITGDKVGSGWIKYVVGLFADRDNAAEARDKIRTMGYSDAFVVAYCDGERIPVYRAIELMNSGACVPIIESDEDLIAEAQTENEENKVEEGSTLRTKPQTQIDEYAYNKAKNAAKADVVESKDGLFYTVQVGVYNTPVTQEQLFNIDPLITKRLPNGQIRYSSGVFNSVEEAQPQKEMAIDKGVKDAYIVAYFKGKRISVAEARNIVEQKGDEILELKNPTPVYKTKDLVVENSEIEEINSEEGEKLDPFIKDYNVQKVFVSKERYKEYPSQVLNALNNSGDLFYFDQKSKRIKSFLKGNNEELSALNEMDFDEVLMFKGAYKVLDKKTPYKKKALQYSDADLIQLNVNIEKQNINSDLMEAILHASTSKEIISQNDEISVQFYALDNEQEREDMDKLYALLSKLGATNIEKIIISI